VHRPPLLGGVVYLMTTMILSSLVAMMAAAGLSTLLSHPHLQAGGSSTPRTATLSRSMMVAVLHSIPLMTDRCSPLHRLQSLVQALMQQALSRAMKRIRKGGLSKRSWPELQLSWSRY
jgi:hypothetical protein